MNKKFKAIYEGYKNYIFPTSTMEELATERTKLCSECPHCIENALLKITMPDKTQKEIQGAQCDICKCPLSAKVRQIFESCPINTWS